MKLEVAKWGYGLALRLPASLVRQLDHSVVRQVHAEVVADGTLVIRPAGWSCSAFAAELEAAHAALPMGASVNDEVRREHTEEDDWAQLFGIAKGAGTHSLRDRKDRY